MKKQKRMPAEWEPQYMVQLTFPHSQTDWAYMLDDAIACFVNIARQIAMRQLLLVVCHNKSEVQKILKDLPQENIVYSDLPTNDTWARDHGGITVFNGNKVELVDFTFNGWGMKFSANLDNQITNRLYRKGVFADEVSYKNRLNFILEGGSIESNGTDTILTTSNCLLSLNRNNLPKETVEKRLKKYLGAQRILWLNHGYLAGDDTDNHIDTLARFCSPNTIAYVCCNDSTDEHYHELKEMEKELMQFSTHPNRPNDKYKLIPLPMAEAVMDENGNRLPATYANFLIMNKVVLMPYYNTKTDEVAKQQLQKAFPMRAVIGIDCTALIRQHGSLHCVTMQYHLPKK